MPETGRRCISEHERAPITLDCDMTYWERFERELSDLGLREFENGNKARVVAVGERVVLDVNDTPYSGYEIVKVSWIIPGTIVKGYAATRKNAKAEAVTPADLSKPRIVFHWVDAGKTRAVRFKITYKADGAEKSTDYTVGTFDVVAPKLDQFLGTSSSPRVFKSGTLRGVRFGNLTKDHGVHWDWKVTLPAKQGGSIKDLQTIRQSRERSHKTADGVVKKIRRHPVKKGPHEQLDQSLWDDGTEPTYSAKGHYAPSEFPMSLAGGKSWRDKHTWDSPHTSLEPEDDLVTVDDHFKYYILYKPDTADAIWVPIAKAEWFWSFQARRGSDGWKLEREAGRISKKGTTTTEFPEYESNVSENDWFDVGKDKEVGHPDLELAFGHLEQAPSRAVRVDVKQAARDNRALARRLGWARNLNQIARLLDVRGRTFPQALAVWQHAHGLAADGVLGPGTWTRMQQQLRLGPAASVQRSTEREDAPPAEYERLTKGQLGKAFAEPLTLTKVSDDVITAIASSKTFQDMAKAIEAKYVALADVTADETVEDGMIVKGKRAKKPVLMVSVDPSFSMFATAGSIDSDVDQDTIVLHLPDTAGTAEWVQQIALGTARAFQWVTRKKRADDANTNIRNALQRDLIALQDADRVVFQAYSSKPLKGQKRPPDMERPPERFEREMYGSQFRHTALEHHVLNEFAAQDIIASKLKHSDIRNLKGVADAINIKARPLVAYISDPEPLFEPVGGGSPVKLDSKYATQRAVLRVINARWQELGDIASAPFRDVREMLDDHRSGFFQGVINYRPEK